MAERLGLSPSPCEKLVPFLGTHVEEGVDGKRLKFLRDMLGARVWRLQRAYRFACSPFMAGFMELKHSERRQLQAHERLRGPGQVRAGRGQELRDELRAPDQRLGGVPKTDRSKACMSVPTQVGARTLQLSDGEGLLPPHGEALPEDEAALHGHRLRDGADLQAAPRHGIEVMGQLGKLGDETFPARILDVQHPHGPARRRAQGEAQDQVPKKAVTNVRQLEYRAVLEEGSERRAPLRSCAAARTR